MEPKPLRPYDECRAAPFVAGDKVRYVGQVHLWRKQLADEYYGVGEVQWCRHTRIGVGPITWVCSVFWPKINNRHRNASTARYLANNLALVQAMPMPGDWEPRTAALALRAAEV